MGTTSGLTYDSGAGLNGMITTLSGKSSPISIQPTPSARVVDTGPSARVVSSPSTGSTSGGYQNFGWYNGKQYVNGQWYDTPQQGTSSGGDSGYQEPSIDWDALYAPIISSLENQQNTAISNASSLENEVGLTKDLQLKRIGEQEKLAENKFAGEEIKIDKKRQSALEQSIRDYNAQTQMGISRFGGGSSAGRAMGELANVEYWRNQGKITESFNDLIADVQEKKASAFLAFTQGKEDIEMWSISEVGRIKRELADRLDSIKSAIGQTNADKQARRMEALDRSVQQAREIRQQKEQALFQLDIWKKQTDYLIENKLASTFSGYSANTDSFYRPTTSKVTETQQPKINQLSTLRVNPNTGRLESEDGSELSALA